MDEEIKKHKKHLNSDTKLVIKEMYEAGDTYRHLAKIFDVHPKTIRYIVVNLELKNKKVI